MDVSVWHWRAIDTDTRFRHQREPWCFRAGLALQVMILSVMLVLSPFSPITFTSHRNYKDSWFPHTATELDLLWSLLMVFCSWLNAKPGLFPYLLGKGWFKTFRYFQWLMCRLLKTMLTNCWSITRTHSKMQLYLTSEKWGNKLQNRSSSFLFIFLNCGKIHKQNWLL